MEDVAKILDAIDSDLITARQLARKTNLPELEQRTLVRALLRQVHGRVVEAYKVLAYADAPAEAGELEKERIPA